MKLKITNKSNYDTVCPSQFDFDVVDHPVIKSGYIRYRHGFLRCELYGDKGAMTTVRSYGILVTDEDDGWIDFNYALMILRSNMGVVLKWDKVEKGYNDDTI